MTIHVEPSAVSEAKQTGAKLSLKKESVRRLGFKSGLHAGMPSVVSDSAHGAGSNNGKSE